MSELRLQSEIAREFSVLFPSKRGQLFHISNERNNQKQAFQARAIGIFPGVADLIYFEKEHSVDCIGTIVVAIEIKEPGSRHKREHIEQQIEWAKTLEQNGGVWRLVRTVKEAICCTQLDFQGLTIQEVEIMLKTSNLKSILF